MSASNSLPLVKKLKDTAQKPVRKTSYAAGFDLFSAERIIIPKRGAAKVSTGLAFCIPDGCYGRIASRSGLSFIHNIEVGAGVMDRDYRDELFIKLYNHSDTHYIVEIGDRIAQLILEKIDEVNEFTLLEPSEELPTLKNSTRTGGLGSTGK